MPRSTRFPWAIYWLVLAVIGLLALAPLLSVLVASFVASAAGCRLDEGSVHPCLVLGADRGEALYTMFVLGWLMLLTLPAGAVAGAGWLVTLLVHRVVWRRRRTRISAEPDPVG